MKQGNTWYQIVLTLAFLAMWGPFGSVRTYAAPECEQLIGAYNSPVVGLATFDNLDDGYRAVIAGLWNGEIHEIFFAPGDPIHKGDSVIHKTFSGITGAGITALSGFYAKDTGYRTVVYGTASGEIYELRYHPYRQKTLRLLYKYPGRKIVSLSSYYYGYDMCGGGRCPVRAMTVAGVSDGRVARIRHFIDEALSSVNGPMEYGFFGKQVLAVAAYHDGQDQGWYVSLEGGDIYHYLESRRRLYLFTAHRYAPAISMSATADNIFAADRSGWVGFLLNKYPQYYTYPPVTKVAVGEELWRRAWARGSTVYTDKCFGR